jgi:hypothetical protein
MPRRRSGARDGVFACTRNAAFSSFQERRVAIRKSHPAHKRMHIAHVSSLPLVQPFGWLLKQMSWCVGKDSKTTFKVALPILNGFTNGQSLQIVGRVSDRYSTTIRKCVEYWQRQWKLLLAKDCLKLLPSRLSSLSRSPVTYKAGGGD